MITLIVILVVSPRTHTLAMIVTMQHVNYLINVNLQDYYPDIDYSMSLGSLSYTAR